MTETGDHGGDSKLELETVLFFYSKKRIFSSVENIEAKVGLLVFGLDNRVFNNFLRFFFLF